MTIDLSIVVPVCNEEGNISPLHDELAPVLAGLGRRHEILYVDDGSVDDTFSALSEVQRKDSAVAVLRLARNYGQTAALTAGFDRAAGEIVVTLDADGQNDPADIPALLAKLDAGYDLVSGWRSQRLDPWLTRRLPSVVANAVIGWATGVRLHDYGCGLKAFRRGVLEDLQLYGEMHRFIPALAANQGARTAEIQVNHRQRRWGVSKYGLGRTVRVLLDLITVKFLWTRDASPIQIFGGVGLLGGFTGLAITGVLGFQRVFLDVPLASRPLLWLGILLIITGVQLLAMGLLGELLVRTHRTLATKPVYRIAEIVGPGRPAEPREAQVVGLRRP